MSTRAETFDVVIVGCGPIGAGAAILFAREGLSVAILDRATAVYDLPRAVFLDGETTRTFQRVGLGAEIEAVLHPWRAHDAAVFTNSRHEALFGVEMPLVGVHGWRNGAFFDQPEFEGRLRELMAAEPCVEVRLGCEVRAISQDDEAVLVEATELATGRPVAIRARWAVACDGAASFVRRSLGIPWRSLGYDHDWLVVDIVTDHVTDLPNVTMQVCDPARLATYICGKDPYRRWEFRLLPGESRDEMTRSAKLRELLDPWIAADRYEVRRAAVYQFHAATAERWREGRILLAGDAAHQTPPFLGQGLNAGFRDVANLAWKLPLVVSGRVPETLLDSYSEERGPHAHELVDWAVAVGRLMDAMADAEAGRASGPPPDDLMRSGYGQGRTVPPLRGGLVVSEQVSDLGVTGYLFSQPTVRTRDGRTMMLDELLGPAFAIVARDRACVRLDEARLAWFTRLGGRVVTLDDVEIVDGTRDRLFDAHEAALVRPDRYVYGVTDDAHALDDLVGRLQAQITDAPAAGTRTAPSVPIPTRAPSAPSPIPGGEP